MIGMPQAIALTERLSADQRFLGFGQKTLSRSVAIAEVEFEVTDEQLRAAPSFAPGEEFACGDRSDEIQVLVRHYPVHHGWE
jgi:hypothetical protein